MEAPHGSRFKDLTQNPGNASNYFGSQRLQQTFVSTDSQTQMMNQDSDTAMTPDTETSHRSSVIGLILDTGHERDSLEIQKSQKSPEGGPTQTMTSDISVVMSDPEAPCGSSVMGLTKDPRHSSDPVGSQRLQLNFFSKDSPVETTSMASDELLAKPTAIVAPFDRQCSCMVCVKSLKDSVCNPQRSERNRNQVFPTFSLGSRRFPRRVRNTGIFRGVVFESDSD